MSSGILVATDGRPGALGALRVARLLAQRRGSGVAVIAACEPTGLYPPGSPYAVPVPPPYDAAAALEALRSRVHAQLAELGSGAADWPISVEKGSAAATIARAAVRQGAGLIVLGLRQPNAVERWLARETLLRLVHLADAPVLAVPERAAGLPRRAVLAVDFSEFSQRAARRVIDTLAPGARLYVAHATWTPVREDGSADHAGWTEWERSYRAGVERRLEEFTAKLGLPDDVSAEVQVLAGDPGTAILRLADQVDADLIAAGSHGAGYFGRIVLGSVSGKLVHGSRCALLIAPPRSIPEELALDLTEDELLANLGMAGELTRS
ncbi:MAG TPA: universal stress protein [Longimicrobiaceae bacterium]|nr:universal stress protein [Longimicrobiaceae bacterium]